MDLREYWNHRVLSNERYKAIGNIGYSNIVNKYREELLFEVIDKTLKEINFSLNKSTILDAGCGTGVFLDYYLKKKCRVFSFDFASEAIKVALRQKLKAKSVVADVSKIPFKNDSFDLVHCFRVLYHILDDLAWEMAIKEIFRITKKNGILLLIAEWVEENKNITFRQKYRKKTDYLKMLTQDSSFRLIKLKDLVDIPVYPHFADYFTRINIWLKLFKKNEEEKLIVFVKN